jgi:hypothetical protein
MQVVCSRRLVETSSANYGGIMSESNEPAVSDAIVPAPLAPQPPAIPDQSAAAPIADFNSLGRSSPVARLALTSMESFWYIIQCICFGGGYLAKVPTKKALEEAGLVQRTAAERVWYVVLCICFGAGYFAKVPAKKALEESGLVQRTGAEQFWYVVQCIAFGHGYFLKVPMAKAIAQARLLRMTDAAQFWYVVQCICFGAGYLAKVPHKKALTEAALPPASY